MTDLVYDEDLMIAVAACLAALALVYFAARSFGAKQYVRGVLMAIIAALCAAVALFFTTFSIRLF
jgi:hypothetical protein